MVWKRTKKTLNRKQQVEQVCADDVDIEDVDKQDAKDGGHRQEVPGWGGLGHGKVWESQGGYCYWEAINTKPPSARTDNTRNPMLNSFIR